MSETFRALRLHKTSDGQEVRFETLTPDDLAPASVHVRVTHSTLNYKDGLAVTGKAPIVRSWPLIPGIDFAGEAIASEHPAIRPGDRVVLNGYGVGESWNGGYAGRAQVKGEWLVKLPETITNADAMAIGTAGYTAMLCVLALEEGGLSPSSGDILVSGAAGGVGSTAILLLSHLGYRVIASSRRKDAEGDYLAMLGASEIIDATELSGPGRPLGRERWAGAIDSVGSHTLASILASTRYGGVVAACGLAQGMDLPASVAPFILRNIRLAGVDSVMRPLDDRKVAWRRLASDLDRERLWQAARIARLEDVPALCRAITEGQVRGRVCIDMEA